jgi:hypothetical protein
MKSFMKYAGFIFLVLSVALLSSCVKDSVEEPSPLGPSGYAISLKVSASPNVLFAGSQSRQTTTVTAVLTKFDGTPMSGRTVFFEIRNALSARAEGVGYFEGMVAAASRVTDGSGRITIDYYGPTLDEIPVAFEDANFYITAHVAWEGSEEISEWAPIYFVRNTDDLIFKVTVEPNVLWCTNKRPESAISVYFAVRNGDPLAGKRVFFRIKKGKGRFKDGKTFTFKETGADGRVVMIYQGPTGGEMTAIEEMVTIEVQPETWWEPWDEYGPPPVGHKYWFHQEFDIRLKKGN